MKLEVFSSESRRDGELEANVLISTIKNGRNLNTIIERVEESHIKTLDCHHNSCLHYAVEMYQNDLSDIELLLKYGASTNVQNVKGDTPLHFAVRNENCNVDLIRVLLDNNGNPNVANHQKETPLHIIIKTIRFEQRSADVVKLLLDRGADPNIRNDMDISPMTAAFGHNPIFEDLNWSSISELMEHGADVNYSFENRSILYIAMHHKVEPRITEKIFQRHLDLLKDRDDLGIDLHLALRYNFPVDVIKQLLYHGSDINNKNDEWDTPLHVAALLANPPIVETLINNGADINARNKKGNTPLIEAMASNPGPLKLQAIEMLLCKGADVNVKNYRHKTAIYYAKQYYDKGESIDIIKILLGHGADPNEMSNLKLPAFDHRQSKLQMFFIPFLVLWNFHDRKDLKRPKRVINIPNCSYNKASYKYLLNLCNYYISELMAMKNDKVNEQYSLYQYVYDNITKSKASVDYPIEIVGEVLIRENKYEYSLCKDLLMASLKRNKLLRYLPDVRVYINQERTKFFDYGIVTCIGKYLDKLSLINFIKAFS